MAGPKVAAKNPLVISDSLRMRKRRKLLSQDDDFDAAISDASSPDEDEGGKNEDASVTSSDDEEQVEARANKILQTELSAVVKQRRGARPVGAAPAAPRDNSSSSKDPDPIEEASPPRKSRIKLVARKARYAPPSSPVRPTTSGRHKRK